ncbi:putative inactive receptor kinase [Hibiscus syriacus]|uniref:Inactive receptor kinase n=2 Tax=Hibiscus syriacus TaxID=106335 RepID=A0A6A2Y4K9_HIBSY|nr:putative inactive receptor kinase [Hibiscus syriacus]
MLGLLLFQGNADLVEEDKQALLDFVNNIRHSRSLNWNQTSPVCNNWIGVSCNKDGSRIISVRLPGIGLHGPIPVNTISRLSALQILSLRSNGINGHFPSDFFNLRNLSFLYLQYNNFSGSLPVDFSAWNNLTIVNLSNNRFSGSIPSSLPNSTQALNLANNSLSGEIPDLNLPSLQRIDLSNNNLTGVVPKSLLRFPVSVFEGNNVSFESFPPRTSPSIAPSGNLNPTSKKSGRLGETALMGIIIASCVLVIIAFVFFVVVCCSRRKKEDAYSRKLQVGELSPETAVSRNQDANNRLFFFEGCSYTFDLEDLLRASAEVLGKGTYGISYKAVLEDTTTVVVKRLKEVSVGKQDFEQQMEVIGSIRHPNVIELKAYYYSKDERLMVYDYYGQGSVSSILHGKKGENRIHLDWDARIKIAIGAARGIARIHSENADKFVHGNIKSSNVFLNSQQYGCVSDLGLSTIMSALVPHISRAAGYRAPEVTDTRKAKQPSDVYSFGVVLLELLTGKSPIHTIGGDEFVHLVKWVHSVVREEWTAEVFDIELMRYPNIEEEMVEMLQIAMTCVVRMPDQRPKMSDLVKMIENVRTIDSDNRPSSGNRSESSTTATMIGRESKVSQ